MSSGLAPARVRSWRNAVLVAFALSGFAFGSWVSRIPGVRDLLGASTQEMGLLVLGVAVGSVGGLLLAGRLVQRLGTTAVITGAYALFAVGLAGAGVTAAATTAFAPVFACLVVLGLGYSSTDVAMNVTGADNERAVGRTVLPLFHAVASLGTVVGAGAGALTVLLGVPLAVHLVGAGAVVAVVDAVVLRTLHDSGRTGGGGRGGAAGRARPASAWRERRVLLLGVVALGMALAEGSANDWLALAMVDGRGTSNAGGTALFVVFVAAMTLSRLGGGPLVDRFGRVPVLRVAAGTAVVGLALVVFVPSLVVAGVGVVLWGLGAGLGFPLAMSAAADDPARAAANVGVVATLGYGAFLVGPLLIGYLGGRVGLLDALVLVLVLLVVSGAVSPAARERHGVP